MCISVYTVCQHSNSIYNINVVTSCSSFLSGENLGTQIVLSVVMTLCDVVMVLCTDAIHQTCQIGDVGSASVFHRHHGKGRVKNQGQPL